MNTSLGRRRVARPASSAARRRFRLLSGRGPHETRAAIGCMRDRRAEKEARRDASGMDGAMAPRAPWARREARRERVCRYTADLRASLRRGSKAVAALVKDVTP